jgi:hypothetical protein
MTRPRDYQSNVLEQLLRTARDRGFQAGWAAYRFKARFGRLPWEAQP